jgi:hypothetical protein
MPGSRGSGYVPAEPIKFNGPAVKKLTTAPASRPVLLGDDKDRRHREPPAGSRRALLAVIPARIASSLMYRCHAWLNNETRRRQKPCKGFMMRCRHHQGQIIVAYDVAALIAGAVAMVNSWLAFQILRHANGFDLTPITLVAR